MGAPGTCRQPLDQRARSVETLGLDELEGVARVNQAWDNLRAAVAWACTHADIDTGYRITVAVHPEMVWRGRIEVGDWNEQLMAVAPSGDPRIVELAARAAHRSRWANDRDAFDRFVRRWGTFDHPLWGVVQAHFGEDHETVVRLVQAWKNYPPPEGVGMFRRGLELIGVSALVRLGRMADALDACETVVDLAGRHGPPSLERVALEVQGLVGVVAGRPELLRAVLERTVGIVVPDGTFSLTSIFDTFALLDDGDVEGAARHLRDGLRRDIETGLLFALDANAALFVNIARRLGLDDPLTRVRHLYASRPTGRLYESLMGEELPSPADAVVDEMTGPDLACYIVSVLDDVLECDEPT